MTTVPDRWHQATLAEVARWGSGGTPNTKDRSLYGGTIPWVVIGDLTDGPVHETAATITEAGLAKSSAKLIPPGAILVAMYGASIGRLGITTREVTTNQAIAHAVPHPAVDAKFLLYYLMSQKRQLVAAGQGAAQPNIGQGVLRKWPICFPASIDEQRRIVILLEDHLSRLDAAEAGLASTRRRLVALERSALDTHFGNHPEVPLDALIEGIGAGKSFGASNAPALDDEWGIIKVSAMTWGDFKPQENKAVPADRIDPRFEIREGDLLVSRANTAEYVGASVLVGPVRPKLLLSDKSLRITAHSEVSPEWLWRALQAPAARRQVSALATGTKDSMRNISQVALRQILLPRASPDEQAQAISAFAEVKESSDRLRRTVGAQQRRLVTIRRSLLAAAFSGLLSKDHSALSGAKEMIGA